MSADEVHFRTLPKTNSLEKPEIVFATNLVCYKESKVLSNAIGRDSKALRNCLKTLTEPQRLSIRRKRKEVIRRRQQNARTP